MAYVDAYLSPRNSIRGSRCQCNSRLNALDKVGQQGKVSLVSWCKLCLGAVMTQNTDFVNLLLSSPCFDNFSSLLQNPLHRGEDNIIF